MFSPLLNITNEEHFDKDLANIPMENSDNSCYKCKETTTMNLHLALSAKHKGGHRKSTKHALYVLQYAKVG